MKESFDSTSVFFVVADNEGYAARIKRTFQLAAAVQNITHRASFVYVLNGAAAENQLLQLASEHQLDGQLFIGRQKLLLKGAKMPAFLLNFISGLYVFRILLKRRKLHHDSFIFLYGQSLFLHFPSFLFAKLFKKNICCDLTEKILRRRFDIINPSYLDFELFTHILCKYYDRVIGISEYWRANWKQRGIDKTLDVIPPMSSGPNVNDIRHFDPRKAVELCYVGALAERDQPDVLESVIFKLDEMLDYWTLNVCGVSEEKFFNRLPKLRKLQHKISVKGHVSMQERNWVLAQSHFGLLLRDFSTSSRACGATRIPEYLEYGVVPVGCGATTLDGLLDRERVILHTADSESGVGDIASQIASIWGDGKTQIMSVRCERFARRELGWWSQAQRFGEGL